jgi:hypothetical protein
MAVTAMYRGVEYDVEVRLTPPVNDATVSGVLKNWKHETILTVNGVRDVSEDGLYIIEFPGETPITPGPHYWDITAVSGVNELRGSKFVHFDDQVVL